MGQPSMQSLYPGRQHLSEQQEPHASLILGKQIALLQGSVLATVLRCRTEPQPCPAVLQQPDGGHPLLPARQPHLSGLSRCLSLAHTALLRLLAMLPAAVAPHVSMPASPVPLMALMHCQKLLGMGCDALCMHEYC